MDAVVVLDGVVRDYAWGSPSAIPELLGEPADGSPAAELWFGDHHGDPSNVPSAGTTLDALIAADPHFALGAQCVQRFGTHLPFLLKVLAADRALSMQVHPTLAQARAGFAAEEAAGIPHDAADRNYGDANHKPELLCALTPFDALCGFRPVASTLAILDEVDVPELRFVSELLRGPDGLRAAFTALLQHDDPGALTGALAPHLDGEDERLRGASLAAHDFPGDIGVVLALLLNYVRLQPGEAIWLGAGNVHAYLRGTAVEIMASSDNVLRCGLTPKHIDVDELVKITEFVELTEPRWPSEQGAFRVPVSDFELGHDGASGPRLVLAVDNAVQVEAGGMRVDVARGHAAFVAAAAGPLRVTGAGRYFVASPGVSGRATTPKQSSGQI